MNQMPRVLLRRTERCRGEINGVGVTTAVMMDSKKCVRIFGRLIWRFEDLMPLDDVKIRWNWERSGVRCRNLPVLTWPSAFEAKSLQPCYFEPVSLGCLVSNRDLLLAITSPPTPQSIAGMHKRQKRGLKPSPGRKPFPSNHPSS